MKLKDIEKSLKREHDGTQVPDVMKRAQKAPINKLLDGQRPLRAFDKQTAVRVLWIVMALAVTALLCFGALGIMGNADTDTCACKRLCDIGNNNHVCTDCTADKCSDLGNNRADDKRRKQAQSHA